MKKNMGVIDRVVRIALALVIGVLYFTNVIGGTLGIILGILAIIFLVTSLISFCPLYLPFGLSTICKREDTGKETPAEGA